LNSFSIRKTENFLRFHERTSLILALCYIYSEARYYYTQVTNPALRKAMTAGETLSPKIPNAKYADQENARRSVVTYMNHGMLRDIFDALSDYTNENYIIFMSEPTIRQHFQTATFP